MDRELDAIGLMHDLQHAVDRAEKAEKALMWIHEISAWQHMKLERGDIFVMEAPNETSNEILARVNKQLHEILKRHGITGLVFPHGWKPYVARMNDV